MSQQMKNFGWWISLDIVIGSAVILFANSAIAQINPDTTLPNNTQVNTVGSTTNITGGTQAGSNLFHSFQRFSVLKDSTAYFNNAQEIQNIISRVTGETVSNIDGVIKANGAANLFLINPNGIVFGENARLDIGGSFIGSTASSLKFTDGFEFSSTTPESAPLLTISVPIGLQFESNSGKITVKGKGFDLSTQATVFSSTNKDSSSNALQVSPGKTLALIGGDVDLEGGTLTAEQGRIELGSVGDGLVSLSPIPQGFTFNYQQVQSFRDIRLLQQALADVIGVGSIQVSGANVKLTDGSSIFTQNQGEQPTGSIRVNAAQALEISGTSKDGQLKGGLRSETVGDGDAADIEIFTNQLVIRGGAGITTRAYEGSGQAGNVNVNASESVQLIGYSPINPTLVSSISSVAFGSGDAGNVTVNTARVSVLDGGAIDSATIGIGTGKGGDVTVNALDSVELVGLVPNIFRPSIIAAASFNSGDAGNLTINTSKLVLRDGGGVGSATLGSGDAGSVTVNAQDSIEVSGTALGAIYPSFLGAPAPFLNEAFKQAYRVPSTPSGFSGDVTVNTGRLIVRDSATVDVRNDGTGDAGTLRVNANSIFLDNQGNITATTTSGEGGNIQIKIRDLLLMRNNGYISASTGGSGIGGNISIDTTILSAAENSDISANSTDFRGGQIRINAQGIFGTQFRNALTPNSDITATGSNPQLSGTVQINQPDADPSNGLVPSIVEVVNASRLINQNFCALASGSSFTMPGSGGLPPSPNTVLNHETVWEDWRINALPRKAEVQGRREATENQYSQLKTAVVEAQGWVVNAQGEVTLVAAAPTATPHALRNSPSGCEISAN